MATLRLHAPVSQKRARFASYSPVTYGSTSRVGHKLPRPGEASQFIINDRRVARKTGNTRDPAHRTSSFQPRLPGAEKERQAQVGDRPVATQPMVELPFLQTGSRSGNQGSAGARDVGNVDRSQRRLSTHSGESKVLEVSGIPDREPTVPIHGATLWPQYSTAGVLSRDESAEEMGKTARYASVSIPGRLATATSGNTNIDGAHASTGASELTAGPAGEPCQVRDGADTGNCISRRLAQFQDRYDLPNARTFQRDLQQGSVGDTQRSSTVQGCSLAAGTAGSDREDSTVRPPPLQDAAAPVQLPPQSQGEALPEGVHTFSGSTRSPMVGGTRECVEGHLDDKVSTVASHPDRRFHDGLGHQLSGPSSQRSVDSTGSQGTYQSARDAHGAHSVSPSVTSSSRPDSPVPDRQPDGGIVSPEAGRYQILIIAADDDRHPAPGRMREHQHPSTAHQRQSQCGGGSGIEEGLHSQHRVVADERALPMDPDTVTVGTGTDRHLCESTESPVTAILLTVSRQPGDGGGCADYTVATGHSDLRLPSDHHSGSGAAEDNDSEATLPAVSGTAPSRSDVVPSAPTATMCADDAGSVDARPAASTSLEPCSPEPTAVQSAPLVHQFPALKAAGFSEAVIERMNKVHTDATNKVYLSQWRLFEAWCVQRCIDPLQATSVCICDFFLYLFNERKVQVRTIEGYRSAITFILKRSSGYDLSTCEITADMIRSFKLERPRAARTEVRWDLAVVLQYLQSPRFHDAKVTLKDLTLKAVFLLSLALGKRRSEIHALQRSSLVFTDDLSEVTVQPHSKFLSKTYLSSRGTGAIKPLTVPALPTDQTVQTLCPVRSLKRYVDVTDKFRSPGQRCLFISFIKSLDRDFSVQTISSYIKQLIIAAYKAIEAEPDAVLKQKYNVKAHQVRHVAHSLGQVGSLSFNDIIRTGGWTTSSTFIKHYLQDLSSDSVQRLASVGSFVAIESVFAPKRTVSF